MERNFNINMDGDQFMEWEKKRNQINWPPKFLRFLKFSWVWFAIGGVIAVGGAMILDIVFRTPAPPIATTLIYGVPVPNLIIFTVVISICLSWVLHGFGFIIIKR